MKLKCTRKDCLHEWEYKGDQKFYCSCPRCLSKVKIPKKEVKKELELEEFNGDDE